jgi:glycosyltransferase involved in cell wall biosynthesis
MQNILVSVVVPTYNHEKFIAQCIRSILKQRINFSVEIIIGDDCSTDNNQRIIEHEIEKNKDSLKSFRLIFHEKNLSTPPNKPGKLNFLSLVDAANGKYIAILEGDDYWKDPFKLQKQVDILEINPDISVCHHWQKYAIFKDGRYVEVAAPTVDQGYLKQEVATVKQLFENKLRVKSRTMMFRRKILVSENIPYWYFNVAYGDVPLNFIFGKYGNFYFIDEPMAVYRQTGKGVSTEGKVALGQQKFIEQHYKEWIKIWDYANQYYNFKYEIESTKTVNYFLQKIINGYKGSLITMVKLIWFNLTKRKLSFNKKWANTEYLVKVLILKLISFGRK